MALNSPEMGALRDYSIPACHQAHIGVGELKGAFIR